MQKVKENIFNVSLGLLICIVLSVICNIVGYKFSIIESLPGLLILSGISLAGYFLSFIIPTEKINSVLWISILAILIASPISPVSESVIYHVSNVSIMAVVTPILAYAGVIIGKDWNAFKEVGVKGIIVSIFVIIGTFLISSLMGDFFMKIF
ncbi:MAG: hypothetical protein ACTHWZ_03595 [Peptoniphilaceae bacterium]